jgi:hypothetical protein
MTSLVASIFAASAVIDFELSLLLVRILGAKERPALAIYSVLETPRLQRKGLIAAATAAFDNETDFEIFSAVTSAAESAQAERHRIAHGVWCTCPELPDALVVADSKHLKTVEEAWEKLKFVTGGGAKVEKAYKPILELFSNVFVYRKDDLERVLRDLKECVTALLNYKVYIQPAISEEQVTHMKLDKLHVGTRAGAFQQLNTSQLFRQALDRVRDKEKGNNNPPAQPESPEQSRS